MRRWVSAVLAAVLLVATSAAGRPGRPGPEEPPREIKVDDFERPPMKDGLPPEWQPLTFDSVDRLTRYRIVTEDDNAYLHAEARAAASGLVRRVSVNVRDYPLLKWRWRIAATVKKGDARGKKTDDYAARVYVNFRYDPRKAGRWLRFKYGLAKKKLGEYPPLYTINYIWANKLKQGAFRLSAYTDRAMMVAVRSGGEKAGQWVEEERNVYEDYKKAFGGEPPRVVQVAIMTDTDNTGGFARADYDDIRFERLPPEPQHKGDAERAPVE